MKMVELSCDERDRRIFPDLVDIYFGGLHALQSRFPGRTPAALLKGITGVQKPFLRRNL